MPRLEAVAHMAGVSLAIAIAVYAVAIALDVHRPARPRRIDGLRLTDEVVYLPLPKRVSNVSVEEAILWRRSLREYTSDPITIEQLSLLLWAAYGITEARWGLRAAPSAGATYPLELYAVVGEGGVVVSEGVYLDAGVYKYDVHTHSLRVVKRGDFRGELCTAALGQPWVGSAPISIVVTAVFERTTRVYGYRGEVRYVPMEVGHVGQNVYLMATALGLGTVVVGAFFDDQVARILSSPPDEVPMYIIPVGVPVELRRPSFEEIYSYILSKRGW